VIINIRGTNGSGKTTLARALISPDPKPVDLVWYDDPTKRDPARRSSVEGWGHPGGFLAVGSYRQGCGGMDTVPSFDLQQRAVLRAATDFPFQLMPPKHVICEGVLASTVAGSWLEFFQRMENVDGLKRPACLVAYLDTPLELCLERIRGRQEAAGKVREIKVDLVRDKIKAINATRAKMEAAGIATVLLRHDRAQEDLMDTLAEYGATS
jgi:thymidylate kinase